MMPKEEIQKIYISKASIDSFISVLYTQINNEKEKFDAVVGIERGGLHISQPLSDILGIPHKKIKISFYKESETTMRSEPIINMYDLDISKPAKYLFVDDLIDSGKTIETLKSLLSGTPIQHRIACIYMNYKNKPTTVFPDYYVSEKPKGWLVFPWEANEF